MESQYFNWYNGQEYSKEREIEKVIFEDEKIKICLTYSLGQETGWYDQEERETVALVEGEAILEYEWGCRKMTKGDVLLLEPHERHRIQKQEKCIWYCVFEKP